LSASTGYAALNCSKSLPSLLTPISTTCPEIQARNDSDRSKFPELKQKDGVNNYGSWVVKAK
jgi:hypothetical protein